MGSVFPTKRESGGGGTDAGCCEEDPVGDTADRSGTRIGRVRPIKGEFGGAGRTGVVCGDDGGDDEMAERSGTLITRVFPIKGWAFGAGFAGGGTTGWGGWTTGGDGGAAETGRGVGGRDIDFVGSTFGMATVGYVEENGTGPLEPAGAAGVGAGGLGACGSMRRGVAGGGVRGAWGLTVALLTPGAGMACV